MDIMELGAIGELVGGIAVIGSLIYVGLQVRQSNEQARRSNAMERARTNREVSREANDIFLAMNDPEILKILRESLVDFDSISDNEKSLLHMRFLTPIVLHVSSTFLAARDDLLDEEYAETWLAYFASLAKTPGIRAWWSQVQGGFTPAFVEEVDRLCAAPDGPPPYHLARPWFAPERSAP